MNIENLKRELLKIKNLTVTKSLAGEPSGSIFYLTFGDEEYLIFVYCSWRLIQESKIITGWHESNEVPFGPLTKGINSLENDVIKEINLSKFYDLNIKFKSGKELQIFCDITPNLREGEYLDENWDFTNIKNNMTYIISKNQTIITQPYCNDID